MNCMDEWIGTENSEHVIDDLVELKMINQLRLAKAKLKRAQLFLNFIKKKELTRASATLHPITFTNRKLSKKCNMKLETANNKQ